VIVGIISRFYEGGAGFLFYFAINFLLFILPPHPRTNLRSYHHHHAHHHHAGCCMVGDYTSPIIKKYRMGIDNDFGFPK
jgi:hypothetical protein